MVGIKAACTVAQLSVVSGTGFSSGMILPGLGVFYAAARLVPTMVNCQDETETLGNGCSMLRLFLLSFVFTL